MKSQKNSKFKNKRVKKKNEHNIIEKLHKFFILPYSYLNSSNYFRSINYNISES